MGARAAASAPPRGRGTYPYNATQLAFEWGDPSNIIKHPTDGHYYVAIWNRNQVGLQPPGICMMRTATLLDPASWRAWNGSAYTVRFVSPYEVEPGREGEHICAVTNLPAGSCVPIAGQPRGCQAAGLSWSTYLQTFVAVLGCGETFRWATSDDLIVWSEPKDLDIRAGLSPNVSKMVRAINYPTFLDPASPRDFGDRNYGTIGRTPYLFWASVGYSPYTDGRHQWATPFTFDRGRARGVNPGGRRADGESVENA